MAKIKTPINDYKADPRLEDDRGITKEWLKKADYSIDCGDTGVLTMRDSPIERAMARSIINGDQYKAAIKLYHHWYRAGLAGSYGSMDLTRVFGGEFGFTGMPRTELEQFHRERFRGAIKICGQRGSWVLERVVCRERNFEETGRELGWHNKAQATAAAIQVTRDALDILVKEWGLS